MLQLKDSKAAGHAVSNRIMISMEQIYAVGGLIMGPQRCILFYCFIRYWLGVIPVIRLKILMK